MVYRRGDEEEDGVECGEREEAISTAPRYRDKCGLCGREPSLYLPILFLSFSLSIYLSLSCYLVSS